MRRRQKKKYCWLYDYENAFKIIKAIIAEATATAIQLVSAFHWIFFLNFFIFFVLFLQDQSTFPM